MRSDFDLDESILYLNSGTHSLCPREVLQAQARAIFEYDRNPTGGLLTAWSRLWEMQKRLAAFVGAEVTDLFLWPNVTGVLNAMVLGVPLAQGEVLLSDLEYPAIANLCRYRAERDGLSLRTFHLPSRAEELTGLTVSKLVAMVVAELRPETRLLMLSHVATGNGLLLPIEEIARETRKRGVVLVVDGAHAVGALPLDFKRLADVDFYGGNLHKWMMGPKGTAFGWVAPRHQATLPPLLMGWTTYSAAGTFADYGGGNRFSERFALAACHDFAPWFALNNTFDFWDRHGADAIRARIHLLQDALHARMTARLDWPACSPADASLRGPLLAYELPAHLEARGQALMLDVLHEHRLQISAPKLGERFVLRLSPHVYNTEAELDRALDVLCALAVLAKP